MVGAALQESLPGSQLKEAFGYLESYAGFAVMAMPIAAGALTKRHVLCLLYFHDGIGFEIPSSRSSLLCQVFT
jgi:hypothetical protein